MKALLTIAVIAGGTAAHAKPEVIEPSRLPVGVVVVAVPDAETCDAITRAYRDAAKVACTINSPLAPVTSLRPVPRPVRK